ncbi:hypothetical protein K450DRAFT_225275 [Umbelopsis ramanniana AG]|uniref:Uncharacterized protein n=1 Tax=Umbelopsis ramanniana AG TaxID=1314678 RepID=A0AAD5EFR1_UMBRA|nr:uncharacterized protein K450DRAFT_225275 [Umbelopsis ramanniana AG]KAI8582878.1 hypothetical protein K450DRAFT_225275 [Umbelopsis ramanniana AG]
MQLFRSQVIHYLIRISSGMANRVLVYINHAVLQTLDVILIPPIQFSFPFFFDLNYC